MSFFFFSSGVSFCCGWVIVCIGALCGGGSSVVADSVVGLLPDSVLWSLVLWWFCAETFDFVGDCRSEDDDLTLWETWCGLTAAGLTWLLD